MAQQVKGWTCLAQILILKWGDGGRRQGNIHCQGHLPIPGPPPRNTTASSHLQAGFARACSQETSQGQLPRTRRHRLRGTEDQMAPAGRCIRERPLDSLRHELPSGPGRKGLFNGAGKPASLVALLIGTSASDTLQHTQTPGPLSTLSLELHVMASCAACVNCYSRQRLSFVHALQHVPVPCAALCGTALALLITDSRTAAGSDNCWLSAPATCRQGGRSPRQSLREHAYATLHKPHSPYAAGKTPDGVNVRNDGRVDSGPQSEGRAHDGREGTEGA